MEDEKIFVSIPFIAGQWSLRAEESPSGSGTGAFQSPTLRGSGRFAVWRAWAAENQVRFNPLHCGAVVASWRRRRCARFAAPCFNPLHCGAVVASGGDHAPVRHDDGRFNPLHCGAVVASSVSGRADPQGDKVSIPFIAGQWSLQGIEVHLQETFSDVVKTDKTGLSKTAHTRWMISAFANFLPGSTIFRLA